MQRNDNSNSSQKVRNFFERNGFYVVLFGCLAVVGTTALITYSASKSQVPQAAIETPEIESQPIRQSNDESLNNVTISPTATPEIIPSPANAEKSDQASEQTLKIKSPKEKIYIAPVEGKILLEYANDKLVYSKTLDQWASHNGIDIAADLSTPVLCIDSGTVEKVYTDPLLGFSVSVLHENNIKSVYCNLETLPSFAPGDVITSGEIIGTVGNSALSESSDPPHLHFELYKKDKSVDATKQLSGLLDITK